MNDARLASDRDRLLALVAQSPSLITIDRTAGNPPREYLITLRCRSLAGVRAGGPEFRDVHTVHILLGPNYPFDEPGIEVKTPIFHPHVFPTGRVCLGGWMGTEYLDLLVKRLFRILQFDPSLLDEDSPANIDAQDWVDDHLDLLPLGAVVPGEAERPKIRFTATR